MKRAIVVAAALAFAGLLINAIVDLPSSRWISTSPLPTTWSKAGCLILLLPFHSNFRWLRHTTGDRRSPPRAYPVFWPPGRRCSPSQPTSRCDVAETGPYRHLRDRRWRLSFVGRRIPARGRVSGRCGARGSDGASASFGLLSAWNAQSLPLARRVILVGGFVLFCASRLRWWPLAPCCSTHPSRRDC